MMSRITQWCARVSTSESTLWLVVILTLVASLYRGYGVSENYYAISQWLVTYESGFIKRALLGTLVQLEALSEISGVSTRTLHLWISNVVLLSLHGITGLILLRMVRLNSAALVFVPYFLVGPLLRTQSVYIGYTDQIVMLLGIAIVYLVIRHKEIAASMLLSASVLVHETVFCLVAPVIFYRACILYASEPDQSRIKDILGETALFFLVPALIFTGIMAWQEIFLPKDRILAYLHDMLSRQDPPNYRIEMISEIYTFSFADWYAIHANEALSRMLAWTGPGGYIGAIWAPAIFIHAALFLAAPSLRRYLLLPFLWGALLSPLVLHWWVVDHDRVSNLVTWVSFLSLWVFLEQYPRVRVLPAGRAWAMFVLVFLGFLFPQARSDLELGPRIFIYLPLLLWLLLWRAGTASGSSSDDSRVRVGG